MSDDMEIIALRRKCAELRERAEQAERERDAARNLGPCMYCDQPVYTGEHNPHVAHAACEDREREAHEAMEQEREGPCIVERGLQADALQRKLDTALARERRLRDTLAKIYLKAGSGDPMDFEYMDEALSGICDLVNSALADEPEPAIKPNETSELRQHLKDCKDTVAKWPAEKLHGVKRPQMAFRTHTGTAPPPDLAPAQVVETRRRRDGATYLPTCARDVDWDLVSHYRPLLDPDGLPYVSGDGLESWAEYVAADEDGRVFQYSVEITTEPHYPNWYRKHRGGQYSIAPATHAIPGDWRQSLAKVWREG